MRRGLVLAVAALVVLSGCNALAPGAGGEATTTDGNATAATTTTAPTTRVTTVGATATTADGTTPGTEETTTAGAEETATAGETTTDDRRPWPPEDGPPRVETVGGDRPDLPYSATEVLRRVERLRGLDATDDVRLVVELPPRWVGENRTRIYPDDRYGIEPAGALALHLESEAEARMGASAGVAKAINPRVTETVNVWEAEYVRRHLNESQQVILAHEFTHVLQFQHDLPAAFDFVDTTDEVLVYTALVEGDAVVVHERYRDRYVGGEGGLGPEAYNGTIRRAAWPIDLPNLAYWVGYRYFERTTDSPAERTAVLEDPPETTAALLHPGSAPREPVGDVATPPVEGWTRYDSDRVGELAIRVALRANAVPVVRARAGAAGWRNDRMVYLRNETEDRKVVFWRTRWADASEAREFARTWRAMLDRLNASAREGLLVVPEGEHWPATAVRIHRDGPVVDVVTGERTAAVRSVLAGAGLNATGTGSIALDAPRRR